METATPIQPTTQPPVQAPVTPGVSSVTPTTPQIVTESLHDNYVKGSFKRRLGAFLIDFLLCYAALVVVRFSNIPSLYLWISIATVVVALCYAPLFIWKWGATPGKMVCKLKVVKTDYQKVGFWRALLRETFAKWISSFFFNLGYFWMFLNKQRMTWHDEIAQTVVVEVDSNRQLMPSTISPKVSVKNIISFFITYILFGTPFIFLILYVFFFRPFQVNGISMQPNYTNKEYFITKLMYGSVERGDVFVYKAPDSPRKDYIKRVIGLPGETIMISTGKVYINGQLLDETSYLASTVITSGGSYLPDGKTITIPNDSYFMLGDNRSQSIDSRQYGPVAKQLLIGKELFCYFNCAK